MSDERSYRLPAEWEPHEATWIAWPTNRANWPGKFHPIPLVFAEMIRKLTDTMEERVHLIVPPATNELRLLRFLSRAHARTGVRLYYIPTDWGWMRDCGLFFVESDQFPWKWGVLKSTFNGWARYPNWKQDDEIAVDVAKELSQEQFVPYIRMEWDGISVVLEGGSIDVNGSGTLITTEECLLPTDEVQLRNRDMGRKEYEDVFRRYFGATNVLWLGHGIVGDDTHGHVDDICRFVNPSTVVLCRAENPPDPNYLILEENRGRLEGMRLEDGSALEVVNLPMPAPLYFDGQRLPASYANFYIANSVVLVPTFNDPKDRKALGILQEFFPDRTVVGIHAVDLVWGLGTIHCLTREQPAV